MNVFFFLITFFFSRTWNNPQINSKQKTHVIESRLVTLTDKQFADTIKWQCSKIKTVHGQQNYTSFSLFHTTRRLPSITDWLLSQSDMNGQKN